eukprot:gene6980-14186_t
MYSETTRSISRVIKCTDANTSALLLVRMALEEKQNTHRHHHHRRHRQSKTINTVTDTDKKIHDSYNNNINDNDDQDDDDQESNKAKEMLFSWVTSCVDSAAVQVKLDGDNNVDVGDYPEENIQRDDAAHRRGDVMTKESEKESWKKSVDAAVALPMVHRLLQLTFGALRYLKSSNYDNDETSQ